MDYLKSFLIDVYHRRLSCYSNIGIPNCTVRWNNPVGEWFPIFRGVPQGGVLSPYLFACCVDDLITQLKQSGCGIHIRHVFLAVLFMLMILCLLFK